MCCIALWISRRGRLHDGMGFREIGQAVDSSQDRYDRNFYENGFENCHETHK